MELWHTYVIESSGKHRLERMQAGEYAARNSTCRNYVTLSISRERNLTFNCFCKSIIIVPIAQYTGYYEEKIVRKKSVQPTSQSLDVLPSVSKLSNCNGVNLLEVPERTRKMKIDKQFLV